MNRFDRITAILIQLQSKKVVKAQDLADRFEVSLRTIYRDIRSLEEAGVPLYGEAGVGYSIVDGYRLPPVMFTREEATAAVAAEKMMEQLSDKVIRKHYESFMYKVKSVLQQQEKVMVEELASQIHVRSREATSNTPPGALNDLFKAISEKKMLHIKYNAYGKEESTSRFIEPIGVYHENEAWYTVGYCHLREDYRNFRIDRMREVSLTDRDGAAKRISFQEYQEQQRQNGPNFKLDKVIIQVDKSVALFLNDRKHGFGFVSEVQKEDVVEMTFLTPYLIDGFSRWFIGFADHAKIIEPKALIDEVERLLSIIAKKMAGR
jgi:predicted DNA-binding transcriptional regulator YafY